ncbi:asparaginase [Xylophilus sp.]|uniref:asparaginase n=1 Tax=Xylophilus sp. TaxID=2653893 RepID=UPI0013BC8EC5|nr:asparaginase [Xylophilus sp.]KAF1044939.1 MAG: putative L-asparaginase [Xylophilus sp.]
MQDTCAEKTIAVLGTGGTIAGRATAAGDNLGYRAAQLTVADLLSAVPGLDAAAGGARIVVEQVAQLDSKDMDFPTWQRLAARCARWLGDEAAQGIVVTHGTDTLEETGFFLQTVLAPAKPVVLASAMRPATGLQPDGPQNLRDAVAVAAVAGASGVLAVNAGRVHGALAVRKQHTYRLEAFGSGEAGPLGVLEEGRLRRWQPWPRSEPLDGLALRRVLEAAALPRVEIVSSHADADGLLVEALLAQRRRQPADDPRRLAGIVAAGTGNGTLHAALEAALVRAEAAGVVVWRATRCAEGAVLPVAGRPFGDAGELSPSKARIALALDLLGAGSVWRKV